MLAHVVTEEHLHVVTSHQSHGLEYPIMSVIFLFLLTLDDSFDQTAIFHHLSGSGHCVCLQRAWQPFREDSERECQHVELEAGKDELDRNL